VRFEFDSRRAEDMRARTALLFELARELKLLSDIFKIGIVVVNQVRCAALQQCMIISVYILTQKRNNPSVWCAG
jgi:hypothetical protein